MKEYQEYPFIKVFYMEEGHKVFLYEVLKTIKKNCILVHKGFLYDLKKEENRWEKSDVLNSIN